MKMSARKRMKEYQEWLNELDKQWERKEQIKKNNKKLLY